jgi:hypothetical protein
MAYNKSENLDTYVIRSKPVGIGYLDPSQDWEYTILEYTDNSQGLSDESSVIYPTVFTGANLMFSYRNGSFKEQFILDNTTKTMLQNHPRSEYDLSDTQSLMVCIAQMEYPDLQPHLDSGVETGNFTLTSGRVVFKNTFGKAKVAFPLGYAYEQNNILNEASLMHRFIQHNNEQYLLSGLHYNDVMAMQWPIVVDPTTNLQVGASSDDCDEDENQNLDLTGDYDVSGCVSGTDYNSSHRFTSVGIPQGSTVDLATFKPYGGWKGGDPFNPKTVRLKICCIDEDNTSTFSDANKPGNRSRTENYTDKSKTVSGLFPIPGWLSWDVATALQEVINRNGWTSGSARIRRRFHPPPDQSPGERSPGRVS